MTPRKDTAREVLDLALDAPVPGRREWMSARRAAGAALLAFVLAGLAVIGCVVLLYLQIVGEKDRSEQAAVKAAALAKREVLAELDRRTAARDLSDAARQAETTAAVCAILPDLPSPSEEVQRLSAALGCPVDGPAQSMPGPASGGAPPSAPSSSAGRVQPSPRPAEAQPAQPAADPQPSEQPPPSPPPAPSPSPQPSTCLPGPLAVCLPL